METKVFALFHNHEILGILNEFYSINGTYQFCNFDLGSLQLKKYLAIKSREMKWITSVRYFFEKNGFHVSSRLADRLGMRASNVRLFFIYISFFTVGLSFGLYLTLAFVFRLKDMIHTKRSSVFDL